MRAIPITPLEYHIARKIGLGSGQALSRKALAEWQLNKINETIAYARTHSLFYRNLFSEISDKPLTSLSDLAQFPFTTADDIRTDPMRFLCVSQDQVARVVTLRTSGTTLAPKRVFFSESDMELTTDFFQHGISAMVKPKQKVLILMPGTTPGSVGDLLVKALARMDVEGIVHGPVTDPESALAEVIENHIDCLVGIPVQILSMARHEKSSAVRKGQIKSVLLSSDYIPNSIISELRRTWGCDVFQHYGMTEMGLGGGVECRAFDGYHLREADIWFEIIAPDTGQPVPDGESGEVVFTTLTRNAMPLIRYRTGDRSSFITEPCPCGSVLRRMKPIFGRIENIFRLRNHSKLTMPLLDEAIFAIPGVWNYQAQISQSESCDFLEISLYADNRNPTEILGQVRHAIMNISQIREAFRQHILEISDIHLTRNSRFFTGTAKRQLVVKKGDIRT